LHGLDAVNATLAQPNTAVPRIPPRRGHMGIDAGYSVFDLTAIKEYAPEIGGGMRYHYTLQIS
jgi:hypothetical protein